MKEFRIKLSYPVTLLSLGMAMLAMGVSMAVYIGAHAHSSPSWTRADTISSLLLILVIAPTMTAMGVYFIRMFVSSLSVYEIDDIAIAQRGRFGTITILWTDAQRIELIGRPIGNVRITNRDGRELWLNLSIISDPNGDLLSTVKLHAADLRSRQFEHINTSMQTLRPKRKIGISLLQAAIFLFGDSSLALIAPQILPGTLADRLPYVIILAVLGVLLSLIGIVCIVRRITISSSDIVDHRLLFTRRIPLDKIDILSVRCKNIGQGGGTNSTYEAMTIEGTGRRIIVSEFDTDYGLLRDYLRSRVGADAQSTGRRLSVARSVRSANANVVVCSIMLLSLIPAGGYFVASSAFNLWRQHLIDTGGAYTTASIVGRSVSGTGSSPDYEVKYVFNVRGRAYAGSCPFTRLAYKRAIIGDLVSIEYLPSDPHTSRAAQSTVRGGAPGDLYGSLVFLAVVVCFVYVAIRQLKQQYYCDVSTRR